MKKPLAVFLALAFILLIFPFQEFAAAAPRGTGALAGHIYDEDMKTPVRNAVVKLRNLANLKEYESEPTKSDGLYVIPAVEEGRYVMGVLGPNGSYNFHYSIMIKSDGLAKLSVAMKPGESPVMLQQGSGPNKKTRFVDFFKSPAGILVLVAAAEMTLFALVLKEESEASPIID
jgi:hypothetical protein